MKKDKSHKYSLVKFAYTSQKLMPASQVSQRCSTDTDNPNNETQHPTYTNLEAAVQRKWDFI